jgi:predicted Zn finger-like uncharacterized protein
MLDEKYTRCPGCATVFRVTAEQLAVRAGQVRCGQCKTVFDGVAQQVALSPPIKADAGAAAGTGEPDAETPARRDARAPGAPPEAPAAAPAVAAADRLVEEEVADRFAPAARRLPRRATVAGYVAAISLLVLLLAAQAAFHFRDAISTFWPVTRPAFARLCGVAGCTIGPLRDAAMNYLSIEASDLQADPAHRGLLILTATVRNRAGWPLAYPHLELTLTDAQDRVVVRRALAPADYAGGTADWRRGIAPNAEIAMKVFIDASATSQAGYRLYMFYP